MKLLQAFLFLCCLVISVEGYAQSISFSFFHTPLKQVLKTVEKKTGYHFSYVSRYIAAAHPVTFTVKDATIDEVLERCFKDQPLAYKVVENDKTVLVIPAPLPIPRGIGPARDVTGKIMDEKGAPIEGVSITMEGSTKGTISDDKGLFSLTGLPADASLLFTHVGYGRQLIKTQGMTAIILTLSPIMQSMGNVSIELSNGYQTLNWERTSGSFDFINQDLISRSVTTNVLDRIENLTPGLLFNHGDAAGADPLLIRGRGTLYADATPLVVLDNFPYDGSLANINPNDVESITILKDAASASIWGARAGNGVIVITTKSGKSAKPQVTLNSSVTIQGRPGLFNINTISSSDAIDVEESLYNQGFYTGYFSDPLHPPVPPVVMLLNGGTSSTEANAQIQAMRGHDVRNDLKRYFYRTSVNQQHSVNVSGSSPGVNYYLSAGWDHDMSNLVTQKDDRVTLRSKNTFKISPRLRVDATVNFVENIGQGGNNQGYNIVSPQTNQKLYPYAQLADAQGNAQPIYLDYSQSFIQSAEAAGLQDWTYAPLADIYDENVATNTRDYLLNGAMQYKVLRPLTVELKYQFENELIETNDVHNDSSYFVRNLINSFTQVDPVTGALTYPIPQGGILDLTNTAVVSQQGRAQINYDNTWQCKHRLDLMGGWEIRRVVTTGNAHRYYGYDPDVAGINPYVNYNIVYAQYGQPVFSQIPFIDNVSRAVDDFLSYYANGTYTYEGRLSLSASARKDEANLFGVNTNEKGTPLWSSGAGWILSKERFYHLRWLPFLKARATYGYNGNISRLASALTTTTAYPAFTTPATRAVINNPPNDKLRWERVGTFNAGLDFTTRNKVVDGSVEFYIKSDKDLMAQAPVDPTLGVSSFYGNVASMKGRGIDLRLTTRNITGSLKWYSTLVFSYSATHVTKFDMPTPALGITYVNVAASSINPVLGKPVFSYFSYRREALDAMGNPQGYLNHQVSEDYASIISQTPLDNMVYNGPAEPVYFGALRNDLSYKGFSLSFNISYKFDYYFRKPSVEYFDLFHYNTTSGDYAQRWQKPGDEARTYVPSTPSGQFDRNRDVFYRYSSVLVNKADNIRLEDIRLSYDLGKGVWRRMPFERVRLYLYASDLGPIWRANKSGVDPYYNNIPLAGVNLSGGINVDF